MKRYAQWILRHRLAVIFAVTLITLVLAKFATHLDIVIDPVTMAPQSHPYVQATTRIDKMFGSKYLMLVGITPKEGDIFQPAVLERVERITEKLDRTPGVVRSTLISLTARQAKAIEGKDDSFEARPLLGKTPITPAEKDQLKAVLRSNPIYMNTVVSSDFKTAAILVELKERSDGFQKLVAPVYDVVNAEKSPEVDIAISGSPVYMGMIEQYAARINWLFPIALLVIGLLHYEAFRTKQGLILPLVTALMAVVWGLGLMGVFGLTLDIFNSPTPVLILAVAAGHAVQLLKRYYEEYEQIRTASPTTPPKQANNEAVVRSIEGVGSVMLIAGGVAALGFFSLVVFEIQTIRTFGLFTGAGILSALVLEMTFIPAIRSLLAPPLVVQASAQKKPHLWDRITTGIANQVIPENKRFRVMCCLFLFSVLCAAGMNRVVLNSDSKNFFAQNLSFQKENAFLDTQLGGTSALYILIEGNAPDTIKNPAVLQAMDSTQRFAQTLPLVGKTISMVDFLKRMNQAMHADAIHQHRLPESTELISQYLLLYSLSGESTDFDTYVDYGYQNAKITLLLKTSSSAQVRVILDQLKAHTAQVFGPNVKVSFGGEGAQTIALSDTLIQGKILNIVQLGLAVFVISTLAFRAFTAGVIVLMPLVMAVLAVFGAMGALGIPLNVPNALISAMAVGIGADYAIYLLYRMREQAHFKQAPHAVVQIALTTAGKAALYVASAVAGGYGVLALSWGYNVHLWLSMFIVLAMVVSVLGALTLVPSLVLYWQPNFIFNRQQKRPLWRLVFMLMVGAGAVLLAAKFAHAQEPSALVIMQKNLNATKVQDSISNATFTLTNEQGAQRVRKTSGHTRLQDNGDNMRLVRFSSPADIKGTATLLIERTGADDDMWVFLPALGKVRRLSAANKKDSFIGTDFSYGDIMGYPADQWSHTLVKQESLEGAACYVIESVPVSDTVRQNTGYSKRTSWIQKDNFVALRIDITDTQNQPFKQITATDIQPVGKNKRWQPMLLEAKNLKTGHRTSIRFENFQADQNVPLELFTAKELER